MRGRSGDQVTVKVRTPSGELTASTLTNCTGGLSAPKLPDIEGIEDFAGELFHSARWDHDVELRGKRIAVVGTGSTGVQIVTDLAGTAGRLLHFQRTPQWILPAPNRRYTRRERALQRRFPALGRLEYRVTQEALGRTFSTAVVKPGWQRRLISWICRMICVPEPIFFICMGTLPPTPNSP